MRLEHLSMLRRAATAICAPAIWYCFRIVLTMPGPTNCILAKLKYSLREAETSRLGALQQEIFSTLMH